MQTEQTDYKTAYGLILDYQFARDDLVELRAKLRAAEAKCQAANDRLARLFQHHKIRQAWDDGNLYELEWLADGSLEITTRPLPRLATLELPPNLDRPIHSVAEYRDYPEPTWDTDAVAMAKAHGVNVGTFGYRPDGDR